MKFRSLFPLAGPTILAALGFVIVSVPSQALADVEITVASAYLPGVTCFSITYDCVEPSSVEIAVDSTVVETYTPGLDILTVPRSRCLEESNFGSGTHVIAVEADCGLTAPDITTDSDRQRVHSRRRDHHRSGSRRLRGRVHPLHREHDKCRRVPPPDRDLRRGFNTDIRRRRAGLVYVGADGCDRIPRCCQRRFRLW
jgi:hypothetical protein